MGARTFNKVIKIGGKGHLAVKCKQFDPSKRGSLPMTIRKFMEVTNTKYEIPLVEYLIAGYNVIQKQNGKRVKINS